MSKKFGAMILCSAAAVATAFFAQQKDLPAELQNKVSPQAVYMIVNLEGCVRNPYKCPADVWTNGQYDAMVSLAFNLGCGNIKRYYSKKHGMTLPTTIYRAAKAQDWTLMCNHISDFNKSGGRVLKGLQMRRTKEKAICLGE